MISVILSTYNRPDALRVVLENYRRVRGVDFEVVVADDGSTSDTAEVVRAAASSASFRIHHAFQEDRGFRLAAARNLAVRAASGTILVFTDGDCVPLPNTLTAHAERCAAGRAHSGYRLLLDEDETEDVISGRVDAGELSSRAERRERTKRRWLWLKNRYYSLTRTKPRPKLTTANCAVHRADFERVNGFDESFVGWGYEDEDLARRLRRVGVHVADGALRSAVLHLFHPVHVSHRPSARGSPNEVYFRRGDYLTRPLAGYVARRTSELRLSYSGNLPGWLERDAAEGPRGSPEVLVHFARPGETTPRATRRNAEIVVSVPANHTLGDRGELERWIAASLRGPGGRQSI